MLLTKPLSRSDLHSVDAMPECEHKMVSTLKVLQCFLSSTKVTSTKVSSTKVDAMLECEHKMVSILKVLNLLALLLQKYKY